MPYVNDWLTWPCLSKFKFHCHTEVLFTNSTTRETLLDTRDRWHHLLFCAIQIFTRTLIEKFKSLVPWFSLSPFSAISFIPVRPRPWQWKDPRGSSQISTKPTSSTFCRSKADPRVCLTKVGQNNSDRFCDDSDNYNHSDDATVTKTMPPSVEESLSTSSPSTIIIAVHECTALGGWPLENKVGGGGYIW